MTTSSWRVRERHEEYDQAYELGEGVTQYDVDAFGISLAGRAILAYLRDGGPARRFTILSRSQSAISGIANLNSRSIQEHALNFAHTYNQVLSTFEDASISIEWTPADTRLPGFCQATSRAQAECAQPTDEELEVRNVLSATYQKQKSRAEAYEQWAKEWHTKPRTSLAYQLSLTSPPDGRNHPLWAAVNKAECPPSRSSFCTALRLAVGHSFTAEYTRHFKKDFEPLDVICECGDGERTLLHLIFDCMLFERAREEARIDSGRLKPTIYELFSTSEGAQQLFRFLERAPASHKPAKSPWLPGTPRVDPFTDGWYWDNSIT